MEPVEFRDMEYVMAVHEEQSFSGAARKHFISQPVLSRVVRKVERNLGVTLFDRSSIPLKPTPQGQKVLEYFEQKHPEIKAEILETKVLSDELGEKILEAAKEFKNRNR